VSGRAILLTGVAETDNKIIFFFHE
jgi:hypothetical protein